MSLLLNKKKLNMLTPEDSRLWLILTGINTPLFDLNIHFWIEKDGQVFDDYAWNEELAGFKKAFGITKTRALEYDRCDEPNTNLVFNKMIEKKLLETGLSVVQAKEFIGRVWTTPKRSCCLFNSIARQQRIGGAVVFGSVFYRNDALTKKHYIFGLPDAKVYNDYKKQYDPFSSLSP